MAKGKFKEFLGKAAKFIPDVIGVGVKISTGNIGGAFEDIKNALSGNKSPESIELLQEFEAKRKEYELEAQKIHTEDRAKARDMYVGSDHAMADFVAKRVINYNVWVVLAAILIEILSVIYIDDKVLIAIISGAVGGFTTALLQERQQVINFFFGSSMGSKSKDKLIK